MHALAISPNSATIGEEKAPIIRLGDGHGFKDFELPTSERLKDLHGVLGFRSSVGLDQMSIAPGFLEELKQRQRLGRLFSTIYLHDYFVPHLQTNRSVHGLFDDKGSILTRPQIAAAIDPLSITERFAWCRQTLKTSIICITMNATRDYNTALTRLREGTSLHELQTERPWFRPFGKQPTESLIFEYDATNRFMRNTDIVFNFIEAQRGVVTIFDMVAAGPHTLSSLSLDYLSFLPHSFENQVGRTIKLCEWDALSFDLLRSIKEISKSHKRLVPFFRKKPEEAFCREHRLPHIGAEETDLLIGQRNGLLKVEVGPRPFEEAKKLDSGQLDVRAGCAGNIIIPPLYRWIRGVVRDLIVEPALREG